MRNIVVVDVSSTGVNFIQDIINRNYNPIGLELKIEDDEDHKEYQEMIANAVSRVGVDYDTILEKDTYEETLEMVRQYDPVIVVPAAERGVRLANRLAYDLGLLCNPIENIDAMTLKDKMQERIAEHGLRYIRGKVVHSIEEAIQYYDEEGLSEVVVKPTYSAGSVGVRICLNKEEMIAFLDDLFNQLNIYGDKITEVVVQERIKGDEYFVNTVSCDGNHRVTIIWKYSKVKTDEGGNIYDSIDTVNELGLGEAQMVEYAYDVADALGIRYGAVHGEYMIDEKGPVLIEVNCRPAGGSMDAEFLDRISGQHETDSILDAYLNPENFFYERDRGYKLYAHGSLKEFIVPRDILAKNSPMKYMGNRLKSFYSMSQQDIDDARLFVKTQDFETTGGIVYLVHEDGYVLQKDLDFLRSVEKYVFNLVLSDESSKKTVVDENESFEEVIATLNTVKGLGSTLFVSDQTFNLDNVLQVSPEDIDDVNGEFNCVVVNLNKSIVDMKDDMMVYLFLRIIDRVKIGGVIFIPESTFKYIPHGRIGAEAIIKVLDLKLELPLHNLNRMVIASKKD